MIDFSKYELKPYLHFDYPIKFEKVKSYVTDSNKISSHSFLPLIEKKIVFEKFINWDHIEGNKRFTKDKTRIIKYASHLDQYIYKYYSDLLNIEYNEYLKEHHIDTCVTAYRNDKSGKSNIDFSAEVISKIVQYEEAYIYVGDFESYFDSLDHLELKLRLQKVLNHTSDNQIDRLPDHWYKVLRSLTRHAWYEINEIHMRCRNQKTLKDKHQYSYFENIQAFRKFKKKVKMNINKKNYGIPQGTALSAVLANVYAIEFDQYMQTLAKEYGGIYRRYSDDFIIIFPKQTGIASFDEFNKVTDIINNEIKKNEISIQLQKTNTLYYKDQRIIDSDYEKNRLDYLGFVFNGEEVEIRQKSIGKFYQKAKDTIMVAKKRKKRLGVDWLPLKNQIYKNYTDYGVDPNKPLSNFIMYAMRAQETFDKVSPNTNNMMLNQLKNRKFKVEKMLEYKISQRQYKNLKDVRNEFEEKNKK